MSNTNLPPNLDGAISNAASRFGDLSSEIGQQVKLTKAFNKQLGGFVDKIKGANDVFGKLKSPLENLKKSIDALEKAVKANSKATYYTFSRAFRKSRKGAELRSDIGGMGPPVPPSPSNPGDSDDDNSNQSGRNLGDTLKDQFEKLGGIIRDNTQSFKGIITSNIRYFNIADNLVEAFRKFETLQIQSLGMGVNYARFLEANNDALDEARVGRQQLAEVMVSNFAAGIKMNSKELKNLNEEMIATGQDTKALESMNAQLLALTGRDVEVVNSLIKVNREVSDRYQISNDRLVQTMQSLSENFDQASFFGSDAVVAVGRLGTELQGLVGVDMPREINTAISLLIPSIENMSRRQLAGLDGLEEKLTNNTVTLSDLKPALTKVLDIGNRARQDHADSAITVAANQYQVSEQQFRQLTRLAEAVVNGNAHQSEIAKKREEEFNTLKNLREKQKDYFTEIAPKTYEELQAHGKLLNNILLATNVAATAGGLGGLFGGAPKRGRGFFGGLGATALRGAGGLAAGGALAGMMTAGGQSSMGSNIGSLAGGALGQMLIPIPGVGAAIGSIAGTFLGDFIGKLSDPAEKTAEATAQMAAEAERQRIEAERVRREEEMANRENISALETLSNYIQTLTAAQPNTTRDLQEALENNTKELKAARAAAARNRTQAPGTQK